jgi:hypothetical protein
VLSLDTGHRRDYRPGAAYTEYFESADLMFPALVRDDALHQKQQIFGIRAPGGAKAWPLDAFADGAVINDRVGLLDVVLVGDADTRTVRAFESGGRRFAPADGEGRLSADGEDWRMEEDALVSASGERLARVPGHLAYWFAWAGYLRDAELYDPARDGAPHRTEW